jgi:hypothetical protein
MVPGREQIIPLSEMRIFRYTFDFSDSYESIDGLRVINSSTVAKKLWFLL